jgi:hypothetical protein
MTKDNVSYQDKINELRLDFSHPNTKNKIFILLEGESDVRLYRKLYPEANFKIEVLPSGKLFLEKGLEELSPLFKKIIGIRDADFDHLANKKPSLSNLFLTDYHDTEMLMVFSTQTFSAILHEFCDLPQTEHEQVRHKLLEALRFISYFRWYNEINELQFSFEGAGFGDVFEPTNFVMNNQKYVEKILQKSKNAKITDMPTILTAVEELANENHDNFQLCNGHDFMNVLALFLSQYNKKEELREKRISSQFRTAYQLSEYQQTQLYAQVANWLREHGIELIIASL